MCGFLRRSVALLRHIAGIVFFWREFHSSVKPSIPAESSDVVIFQDSVAGVSLTVYERFIRLGETVVPMEHSIAFAAASGRFFLVADRREIRVFSVAGETPSLHSHITAEHDISSLALTTVDETPLLAVCEWRANTISVFRGESLLHRETLSSCGQSSLFSLQRDGLFLLVSCVDGSLRIYKAPSWSEERSFHVTRCAGRWLACEDPSLFLLLGRKSCVLVHSNAAWL